MIKKISIFIAIMMLTGCLQKEWHAEEVIRLQGFNIPEAVHVFDGKAVVSNIVAAKEGEGVDRFWADDASGFVSLLKIGEKPIIQDPDWLVSTPQLPLNSLKGSCYFQKKLWVADNGHLLQISWNKDGKINGKRIRVPGAKWLNDVACDGNFIYVSDTGSGKIFRIKDQGYDVIQGPEEINGITFSKGKMFAVSWKHHEVYEIDLSGQKEPMPFGVAEHFINLDGIEVLPDGSFIVSDFTGNKISVISADRKTVRTLVEVKTPADIGLDRDRMHLYVPLFMEDTVVVFQLSKLIL